MFLEFFGLNSFIFGKGSLDLFPQSDDFGTARSRVCHVCAPLGKQANTTRSYGKKKACYKPPRSNTDGATKGECAPEKRAEDLRSAYKHHHAGEVNLPACSDEGEVYPSGGRVTMGGNKNIRRAPARAQAFREARITWA